MEGASEITLTCADWLAVLEPRLTEPLFDSQSVRRLRSIARLLPGDCQAVLEIRLAPGPAPVDLSLRLLDTGSFRIEAPVSALWLEFDLDQEPLGLPAPVICAKLSRKVNSPWLTDSLLPYLHGGPLFPEQREMVHRALQEIPDSASLLYAFSLRARGSDAVRLEIFGMGPAQILDYLRRVAPARVPEVTGIAPLFEGVERIHLSFDIASEILPRIGIEGSFPRQPPREPRWLDFFHRLVQRGLCSADKRDAALAWPGHDSFWTAPALWPLEEAGTRYVCARSLSHVKVVCRPDREPEAKAYLAFGPLERSAAGAASASAFST